MTRPFGDVLALQRGHDLPANARGSGTVPIIGSFGITGTHNEAAYEGPGVAIGRSGAAIGTPTYVPGPFWPLNTCLFVRDFKGNDPRWVYRLLQTIDFVAFNSGSAQPSLNRNFLRDIQVHLPPVREQSAIAEVLGALDEKIAANERVVESCELLAVAIASEVDVFTEIGNLAGQSTAVLKPDEFDETVAHFSLPAFDDGATPDIALAMEIKSNKFALTNPCVLFSKLNPRIPRIWEVGSLPPEMAVASTEFVVLVPTEIEASVLWTALKQPDVSETITQRVAGTSGSHQRIKPSELLGLPVRDVRELDNVQARSIATLTRICGERRQESARLSRTRDVLLPLLMSGKIRVRDAETVVSEVV